MKKASIRLPCQPTPRKCWIGCYGGHFDVVIVFSKRPKKGKKDDWNEGEYDSTTNKEIVAGTFDKDQFNDWFGTNIQPENTRCRKVEPYELTAFWDKEGWLIGLNSNYD